MTRKRPTTNPTAGVWFAQPERPLITLAWNQTGPYSYETTYGRWQLLLAFHTEGAIWLCTIFDTRAFQPAAAMHDPDQNALRAQVAATMAELVVLEGN